MATLEIKVVGLRTLGRAMKQLGEEGVPNGVKAASQGAAELIAEEGRALAPRGSAPRDPHPGRLAGSVRPRANLKGASVQAGGAGIGNAWMAVASKWAKPYQRHGKTINHKPVIASRFLIRALENKRGAAVELFETKVRQAVREVTGE